MGKSLRNSILVVLASTLALSVSPSPFSASAAPVRAHSSASPAQAAAKALLNQALSILKPASNASARRANAAVPDLTMLLRDLRLALPSLSPADRRTARTLLARPQDPGGDQVCDCPPFVLDGTIALKATTHFLIHYQTQPAFLGQNNVSTAHQVGQTASVLESVYTREVKTMGYRKPITDTGEPSFGTASNPDSKIDVFLVNISDQGFYGYVTSDSPDGTDPLQAPYVVLDNDYQGFPTGPLNSLKVTVAHEFFHAIQYAYDANDSTWFLEGSAVWMEDQVYPTINDYLQYLDHSQIVASQIPVDRVGTFERYGAVTFWKYLSESYHSVDLIHQIWNSASVAAGHRNAIQAVISVLKSKHVGFGSSFARYALWTTLPAGTYADRALFPAFKPWAASYLTTQDNDTGAQKVRLAHLSSASVRLTPSSSLPAGTKVQIIVDAPNNIVGQVRVIEHRANGSYVFSALPLSRSGYGTRTLSFTTGRNSSVVVTMVNVSTSANNQPFTFRARTVR